MKFQFDTNEANWGYHLRLQLEKWSAQIAAQIAVIVATRNVLVSYTVAQAQALASPDTGLNIYVTDETGGAVAATYDGSDFRRSTDRAVIS